MTLAGVFTVLAIVAGAVFAYLFGLNMASALTIVLEFPVRNMAVAATVALNIWGSTEYLLFAALFIVIQTPLMLLLVFLGRKRLG